MMKTAVMTDLRKVEIQERPIPQPKDDEALVKVEYVGICGSDLHYYEARPYRKLHRRNSLCTGP